MVSWFAGLFYGVRLFIYHTEAQSRPEGERRVLQEQYKVMTRKLWYIIATPAMILTLASGWVMIWMNPAFLDMPWMHVKLTLVAGLLIYHFICHSIFNQLQRDEVRHAGIRLRLWNEVATIFLVAIVFTVVLKSTSEWLWGVGGLIVFGILLMVVVKLVNRK